MFVRSTAGTHILINNVCKMPCVVNPKLFNMHSLFSKGIHLFKFLFIPPLPNFKAFSVNLPTPTILTHADVCGQISWKLLQSYNDLRHTCSSLSLFSLETAGKVCLKVPANTKFTTPITEIQIQTTLSCCHINFSFMFPKRNQLVFHQFIKCCNLNSVINNWNC